MDVKTVETFHNGFLILLSASMCLGALSAILGRVSQEGLVDGFLCGQRAPAQIWDGPAGYWTYVYYLSKYYELFDTVILCLRKKELTLLHLWHHTSMLFVTWSWLAHPWLEGSLWCTFVNSLIHVGMYTYFMKVHSCIYYS